ncbi:MAG: hypothetical protein ACT4OZ_07245 [Gemmatimonadota bacterium]
MKLRLLLVATLLLCVLPGRSGAQDQSTRFRIGSVGDTTISFMTGDSKWVRRGQLGTAVDPRRRDTLVARFQVLSVGGGQATALITGQTTAVTTDHVALLLQPAQSWIRSRTFWLGLLLGGAVGAGVGISLSP